MVKELRDRRETTKKRQNENDFQRYSSEVMLMEGISWMESSWMESWMESHGWNPHGWNPHGGIVIIV